MVAGKLVSDELWEAIGPLLPSVLSLAGGAVAILGVALVNARGGKKPRRKRAGAHDAARRC